MKTTPDALAALIGQRVDLIDTPALVVDLDAMERNLQRMADFAKAHGLKLRPHAKMHKSATLGLRQMLREAPDFEGWTLALYGPLHAWVRDGGVTVEPLGDAEAGDEDEGAGAAGAEDAA